MRNTVSPSVLTKLCRLCSLEIEYGFDIFAESEVKASLVILINKYLPIKVTEDEILPKQICESCHIGVAATVDLIDRMVEGQHQLRKLYRKIVKTCPPPASLVNSEVLKDGLNRASDQVIQDNSDFPITVNGTCAANQIQVTCNASVELIIPHISNPSLSYNVELDPEQNSILMNNILVNKENAGEETIPHTLINIQGNSPDIEMDDLAKGVDVKKVYESHPLGLEVEGKKPKRKRGRPRKEERKDLQKEPAQSRTQENERPKRRTNLPSRFRDTFAGSEFDNLLNKDKELLEKEDHMEQFKTHPLLSFADTLPDSKEKTHLLEGNAVIVTPNLHDEALSKLPAAVNIELDFNESQTVREEIDENGLPRPTYTPKASVSSIQEAELSRLEFTVPQTLVNPKTGVVVNIEEIMKPTRRKRKVAKKNKYFCEYCNKGFLQIGRCIFHMKLHKNVVLQCDDCKDRFSNNEDVALHHEATNHTGVGVIEVDAEEDLSIKCPLCHDRTFLTLERYKAHVSNMHEGQKPYPCLVCNKRFAYKHSLKTHYLSHQPNAEKKTFACKKCPKVFLHQSSLIYHNDTHHNMGRKFVCLYCGCSFKHKQLLQRHHLVHSESRPYACKLCDSSFKSLGNLYNHMNIHTKSKRFTCKFCSKKFGHLTSLNLHLRSHTGEKPFGCTYCGKRFSQNGNLQEHVRIHTGVKPYCCSLCGKKFTTSSQLSLHEKRHKGEYKFKCSLCSRGFFNQEAFSVHERKHRGEKTFWCQLCPKAFYEQVALNKHLKCHSVPDVKYGVELAKHLEEHQLEKPWFLPQPSVLETPTMAPSNQDIIYVLSKKEDPPNFEFLSFGSDEIFDTAGEGQSGEQLTAPLVSAIPNNFILSQSSAMTENPAGKVMYPVQRQVGEPSFEISLKDSPESLAFSLPSALSDEPSMYVKRVYDA